MRVEEQVLNNRLHTALIRLKDEKPDLFRITIEEQIGKIAGELSGIFIKWLQTK